jgi:hypothetical protein
MKNYIEKPIIHGDFIDGDKVQGIGSITYNYNTNKKEYEDNKERLIIELTNFLSERYIREDAKKLAYTLKYELEQESKELDKKKLSKLSVMLNQIIIGAAGSAVWSSLSNLLEYFSD